VFGLRYVAYVAGDQPGRAAHLLQWLGIVSARVLHGPVLAVNFVLATIIIMMAGTERLWPGESKNAAWSSVLVLVNVVAMLIAATSAWRIASNRILERFWFWDLHFLASFDINHVRAGVRLAL
jgi:signal transduction histidine kinase